MTTENRVTDAQAAAAVELGDNRPPRYIEVSEDGTETVVYRASAIGSPCLREMVAWARGEYPEPLPDRMAVIFGEGTLMEPVIREMYENQTGNEVINNDGLAEVFIGKKDGRRIVVRGSTDGDVIIDGDGYNAGLWECKKVRESQWEDFLRKGVEFHHNYPWQLAVYMLGREVDFAHFVGGKLVRVEHEGEGSYSYIDEVYTHIITGLPIPYKAIRDKVLKIEQVIAEGFGPMEVECTVKYPCPFYKLHDPDDEEPDVIELGPEFAVLLREAKQASDTASQLSKDKRAADDAKKKVMAKLVDAMKEAGIDEGELFKGNGFTLKKITRNTKGYEVKPSTSTYYTVEKED